MVDPLILPSIAMLSGGGLLMARDYIRRRLLSSEDRYMALYGKDDWEASNMDLSMHFDPAHDALFKEEFLKRLDVHLHAHHEDTMILREIADLAGKRLIFGEADNISVPELLRPRSGVYFDLQKTGEIRVVWNHMQTDGVGMWRALRGLFDTNPPLVPYKDVRVPPPFLPELLAIPSFARQLTWRGRLRKSMSGEKKQLERGLVVWNTAMIRTLREQVGGGPFNLLTSALTIAQVFARHEERDRLNIGLTAYFPFLSSRNKYAVFLCRVKRGSLAEITEQLRQQTRSKMLAWGRSAAQTYALTRMPDRAFIRLVNYYRRQIDVLVSSLPVGQNPISLGGYPAMISCHPWQLTLPYYFLLVGTRSEIHVSYTSNFAGKENFLAQDQLLQG